MVVMGDASDITEYNIRTPELSIASLYINTRCQQYIEIAP